MATKQIPYGLTDFERIRTPIIIMLIRLAILRRWSGTQVSFPYPPAPFREVAILECPQMVL